MMFGVLFLSLCVGNLGTPHDVTLGELRALCVRETKFDFCGSGGLMVTNAVGYTDRELRALLSCGNAHYRFRCEFQNSLESLDLAVQKRDRNELPRRAADVRNLLESLTDRARGENDIWLLLYICLERVSYEMARIGEMAEADEVKMLELVLPERLFVPPPKRIHRASYHLHRGFRRLLFVGALIRQHQRICGVVPSRLDEFALPDGFKWLGNGMSLHYVVEGDRWHLYYAGKSRDVGMSFNVYIPTLKVGDLAKWPCWGFPNYSSDYSRKRYLAYGKGSVLNAASALFACRLENGRFVKVTGDATANACGRTASRL